ncbi:hypothetical protein JCM12298_02110 [Desulfothermus naphthae]
MKMEDVVLSLNKGEVQEILKISLEDDKEGALKILKNIAKKLEKKLTPG